jgi:glutamine amidotransferase
MCRHIAYIGPLVSPAELVLDAPSSLLGQCTTAREMSWGRDNLDGWGIAFQTQQGDVQRHRSARALTEHPEGRQLLRETKTDRYIVHIRQKTPGSATHAVNSAPFSDGSTRFFTHNGYVADFRSGVREQLLPKISPARSAEIGGDTDSELLFALVLSRLDDGASVVEAVGALTDVAERYGGRYNVLFWSGDTIVATRWENSLYVRDRGAVIVTSEPLDDGAWHAVPERTMVIVDPDGVRQEAM